MKQGEVWQINLDPTIGAEIQKTRPCVIVSDDALGKLPLKVIVPITDWKDNFEKAVWMVKLIPGNDNGLEKVSCADCFQVRSVSQSRLLRKLGSISKSEQIHIQNSLALVLSIG
jgi:mRNA interferase MazF